MYPQGGSDGLMIVYYSRNSRGGRTFDSRWRSIRTRKQRNWKEEGLDQKRVETTSLVSQNAGSDSPLLIKRGVGGEAQKGCD